MENCVWTQQLCVVSELRQAKICFKRTSIHKNCIPYTLRNRFPTNHKNQRNIDAILDCSLSKPYNYAVELLILEIQPSKQSLEFQFNSLTVCLESVGFSQTDFTWKCLHKTLWWMLFVHCFTVHTNTCIVFSPCKAKVTASFCPLNFGQLVKNENVFLHSIFGITDCNKSDILEFN